ncbi:MAG TPA: hypothetical protein VFX04_00585 [Rhodanobacteraceae bacterium]|nr:hypothetical protein [Rhodanobacteraceae bacterium]
MDDDIEALRGEMAAMRTELAALRAELTELRAYIGEVPSMECGITTFEEWQRERESSAR